MFPETTNNNGLTFIQAIKVVRAFYGVNIRQGKIIVQEMMDEGIRHRNFTCPFQYLAAIEQPVLMPVRRR